MDESDEPTTGELRAIQRRRETEERDRAARPGDEGEKHERRADRAAYLREKLEEREEAERRAAEEDSG
jgi:hypothetical protein